MSSIHSTSAKSYLRTLRDAVARLNEVHPACADQTYEILTKSCELPNGELTSIAVLVGDEMLGTNRPTAPLPTSATFRARTTADDQVVCEVSLLDHCKVDQEGNASLANGTHLHRIEFIPTPLHFELNEHQRTILMAFLKTINTRENGVFERSFRPISHQFPYMVVFDYGALPILEAHSFKAICGGIQTLVPGATKHEITHALAIAGVRPNRARTATPTPTA